MDQAVSDGVFPGGVLLAARGDTVLVSCVAGRTSLFQGGKAVTADTVFDLASLTKPLATALALMVLVSEKKIDPDAPVYQYVDGEIPRDKAQITWTHLLCHHSGLPDYKPWYKTLLTLPESSRKPALYRMIRDEPLVYPVGEKTVYSDIGFLLLQQGIESVGGESFARFLRNHVYGPLSVSGLFFPSHDNPRVARYDYAATEICPVRGLLQGVVHDENAYFIGGAAGHAGLFGTAGAVFALLRKLTAARTGAQVTPLLQPEIISRFVRVPENARRTPGFDVPAPSGASCGQYFNKAYTIGHLGFTGTSFWMDLAQDIIVVFLTNRVHPTRENQKIHQFRPVIHDAVMRTIL